MSAKTSIEWTEATWNPLRARHRKTDKLGWHCTKPSAGCKSCYAEAMNRRLGTGERYATDTPVDVVLDENALKLPLRWRQPRKVFVCSMTDLFGEFVSDEQIDRVFAVMALASRHSFQVLTKRAERMRAWFEFYNGGRDHNRADYVADAVAMRLGRRGARGADRTAGHDFGWPLPNVWLGVSVEDQQRADERIPHLLATPAAVRFLSCEPLLGAVDLRDWAKMFRNDHIADPSGVAYNSLDWVIVGGESGPKARPFDLAWARSIVEQCRAAGVAVFVKQLGSRSVDGRHADPDDSARRSVYGRPLRLRDPKGGSPEEWPVDLRVREMPEVRP